MKTFIKKFLPVKYQIFLFKIFIKPFKSKFKKSYSQCGEDMILDTIFSGRKFGFYIDIGANNPVSQSNTHHFYKKGWHGINIDANPKSMISFNKVRKRDINLGIPISDSEETLTYYIFSSSFFNSFSEEQAELYKDMLIDTQKLKTRTLEQILDTYLKVHENIDFISIDTEGWDYKVLLSNNWQRYRPKVIIVEFLIYENNNCLNDKSITEFLNSKGYRYLCSTPCNTIYIESDFYRERFSINDK